VTPDLPGGWLRDGTYPLTFIGSDDHGIGVLDLYLDGRQLTNNNAQCGPGQTNPVCPLSLHPDVYVVRPAELSDGVHDLSAVAMDNAFQRTERHLQLRVDRTSPLAPTGLALVGGDRWRSHNQFELNWVNPRETGPTPSVGAQYTLCPIANASHDPTGCMTGSRDGADIDRIDDLAAPASGAWRLRLALRDAAGNVDVYDGATLPNLRLDLLPPSALFLPPDASDPARVRVKAEDEGSGLARLEIEARRQGEPWWRALAVEGGEESFSATLDDDQLPAGLYELRAHAVDEVGNERITSSLSTGATAQVQLPTREGSRMVVGMACHSHVVDERVWRFRLPSAKRARQDHTVRLRRDADNSLRRRRGHASSQS
jgi:hypothetical protein